MACKEPSTSKQSNINAIGEFDFRLPIEAPVFHPTVEEFKDPLGYINKIRPVAEKSGICKIKPPPSWQPPFTVNVDEFKFTPRIQRLNELEAKTRIKLNYLDQIAKFWELQGSSLKIPQVDKKVLDIYTLHMMVKAEGGVDAVTNKKMWNKIATKMGWPPKSSIGPWLKMQYDKILYPFDVFQEMKSVKERHIGDCKNNGELGDDSKISGPDTKKGKSKQKPKSKKSKTDIDPLAKYICRHCFRGDAEASMLLCDGCDDSYHTFCLMPPLVEIPKGDWRCPKCVAVEVSKPVEAFGFEQAQREYTLQQFGEMADQFKCDYFNMPVHMVPLNLVEREFWRVVSSIDEDVIVEYGADLHTMDHGSGFPTKATDVDKKDEAYTNSGWNLNNIPVLPGSVLGHINADISGMKVPWMYVGMCFATFCWHNEDHWSYSINYLHWGEAKTWYGVPGSKAEEFEEVMKKAAPELFQSQPDLLHQLVTIMNPNILMDAGVPVCRTDQQAGEFVVTFPRAYHAGFNQGYNFAEAVNFAPADWLPMGRECISHYSTLRRFCVFSHDELVCGMAAQAESLDLHVANATFKDMLKMVENESSLRETLFEWGCNEAEKEHFELVPDDERQCDVCKTTCFLSAITCPCDKDRLVCLKHFKELCNCTPSRHKLRYRYTLDELPELLQKLRKRGETFDDWIDAVQSAVESVDENKTGLDVFKNLVNEAKEKNIPESELLHNLEAIVKEGEKCAEVIRQMCFCKLGRPRPESLNNIYLPLDELITFYDQVLQLACAIPGTDTLKKFIEKYTKFRDQANVLLNKKYPPIEELENALEVGETLEFAIEETAKLKQYLSLVKWLEGVREKRAHTQSLTKDVICNLLQEGITFLPQDDVEVQIRELQHLVAKIDSWEEAAKQCLLGKQIPSAIGLKMMVEEGKKIPASVRNLDTICEVFKKVQVWFAKVNYYKANKIRLYVDTIDKLVMCAKSLPIHIEALPTYEEQLMEARAWQEKLEKTFLKKNSRYTLLEVLSPRVKWDEAPFLERQSAKEESFLETEPFLSVGIDLHGKREPADVVAEFKKAEELEFHNIKEIRARNSKKWEDGLQTNDFCICGGLKKKEKIFQCSLCLDCFHEDCVPNVKPQAKFRSMCTSQDLLSIWQGRFLCPNCARSRRPRLDTLIGPLVQLQKIPTRIPEGEALQCLLERAMSWQVKVKKILATEEFASALTLISELAQKFVQAAAKQKTEKIILDELEKCDKRSGTNKQITENFNTIPIPKVQVCPQINFQKGTTSESSKTELSYNFCGQEKRGGVDKTKPLITLSSSAQKLLEDLLLEWDLMELSLDEGMYLSRIHQASNFSREQIEQVARLQFREAGNRTFAYLYTCKTPKTLQSEPRPEKDGESSKRKLRPTTKRKTKVESATPQMKKKCIKPPPQPRSTGEVERKEDEEDCASPRCLRPVGLSVDWVQCDGCQSWFHLYCLGLHRRDVKPNEDFLCEGCKAAFMSDKTKKRRIRRLAMMPPPPWRSDFF